MQPGTSSQGSARNRNCKYERLLQHSGNGINRRTRRFYPALITTQVWWAGIVILAISVPLFLISKKAGQKEYTAWKEAEKHRRRADYLKNVILSREAAEERSLFGYTEDVNRRWLKRDEQVAPYRAENAKRTVYPYESVLHHHGAPFALLLLQSCSSPTHADELSSGMFISLVTATLSLVQMMSWQLSSTTNTFAKNMEYLRDLTKFCALTETDGALDPPVSAESVNFGTITFQNVSFRYPGTGKRYSAKFESDAGAGTALCHRRC